MQRRSRRQKTIIINKRTSKAPCSVQRQQLQRQDELSHPFLTRDTSTPRKGGSVFFRGPRRPESSDKMSRGSRQRGMSREDLGRDQLAAFRIAENWFLRTAQTSLPAFPISLVWESTNISPAAAEYERFTGERYRETIVGYWSRGIFGTFKQVQIFFSRCIVERIIRETSNLCGERATRGRAHESQLIFSPSLDSNGSRAVYMEIYRSENDRVERLGKRGFFIGVTYASPRFSLLFSANDCAYHQRSCRDTKIWRKCSVQQSTSGTCRLSEMFPPP